ncbi:uncharacterized protein LOC134743887 [Cydia strobilella]|uniref:uncharacterized protein LOC134743887 n=1 Tax=Cydia strobilella TaxID=1100964 RepID=UPI0030050542
MYQLLINIPFFCYALAHPNNVAWYGGPMHVECEHALNLFTGSGQYIKENVIATKAVSFNDDVYVMTPRMKRGVLATVWLLVSGRQGPALEPFPSLPAHTVADCGSIQNAVDFHLDCIGNLWILDSGIIDTLEAPRCTCKPKVVVISTLLRTVTKLLDLTTAEPSSLLQNVVVDYGLSGKPFVYISDASRGAILVRDATSNTEWTVLFCSPSSGLQITLGKRGPAHNVLMAVRAHQPGLIEIECAALRRRNSALPLRAFGEQTRPVFLLGSGTHHIYLRHADGSDVLSWDVRDGYNMSQLISIHSPGPRLVPTSVSADHLKHSLLILDSNYGDVINSNSPAYQRISFIGQL